MPCHNVLYLTEYDVINKYTDYKPKHMSDSRLIIIYDESEDKYYCFGTRRRLTDNHDKYGSFKLAFSADNTPTLTNWVSLLNNKFRSKYTVEQHQIVLESDEYDGLDFESVFKKISKYTELFAYDKIDYTAGDFMEQLDMLTALANF
jgi:hypothetical protein